LKNLVFFREQGEVKSFVKLMQKKIMEQGKAFFDVWMYEVSDEIQSVAQAFGERYMLQGALDTIEKCSHPGVKEVLVQATFLHMLTIIKQNSAWYLLNNVISSAAASKLDDQFDAAVKAFLPHMNTAVDGLGVPKIKALHGTIARDYVAFNEQDDYDNMQAAGDIFDFRRTGAPRL
jgi:hypothetical protein